ncbi:ketoacyl-ACP synthase III [Paenibacillus sp. FSL R5-0887]|jgi:3-oxoacyl-[acyl-carrier-protein] synthase-3|uniref:ketoacyl-ACP synthase III n=1 Tax=Paenibacillus TaxID=44249 RepID=UPI00096FCAB8|nr:ketoacyl-ACP synthase III [Paenibacillus odorifer]OMC69454.1 hypothetical protein BK121_12465 [Paenibacillus odorifer]OMC78560.1 hypothetical protein BK125_06730 [Paenibacillus odorifer]OMD61810.1 hypothetical protein BSK55_04395 [Paenibacillus odorifer]OMD77556.1 hypothetical protein BSK50_12510 [Paenibacillus odorifer]OMD85871.1 hypothetical protein BSK53_07130 [Paenibacillus odorifer]
MLEGISIKQVSIYCPERVINNQYFIDHFQKQGIDIKRILKKTGRKNRHVIEGTKENSLTMAINAAQQAIDAASLKSADIDLILFSSSTPEYLSPTNSLLIHKAIKGKDDTLCYDLNGNCIGMFIAVEQAARTLYDDPDRDRALVIGSDFLNLWADPSHPITYSIFGDAAVALILEKDHSESGLIDVRYLSDSRFTEEIVYPAQGLAKSLRDGAEHRYLHWGRFSGIDSVRFAEASIVELLNKHHLTFEDIQVFCFSQFTLANIKLLQAKLNLDQHKIIYVADEYGYTGTSSPFLALYCAIEHGLIKRGDNLLFWTLGSGYQAGSMLWRY